MLWIQSSRFDALFQREKSGFAGADHEMMLVDIASEFETRLLGALGQGCEVDMRCDIDLAWLLKRVVSTPMTRVTGKGAFCAFRAIIFISRVSVVYRQHEPSFEARADRTHPMLSGEIYLGPVKCNWPDWYAIGGLTKLRRFDLPWNKVELFARYANQKLHPTAVAVFYDPHGHCIDEFVRDECAGYGLEIGDGIEPSHPFEQRTILL